MIQALVTMTALGVGFGTILGVAARRFHVETPPIVGKIEAALPGTNCSQCGFAGCNGAAEAVADGSSPITLCPPGGQEVVQALAEITGTEPPAATGPETGEADQIMVAFIFEDHCTGCDACVAVCPTEAIILRPKPRNLRNWHWPKPGDGARATATGGAA